MRSAYVNQMRMTVLASGSKGNSAVISSRNTRVLVDAGLSCRELLRRMALVGEDPAALNAILITHEHQDHVAGLAVLARRLGIPVFFTEPTHRAWVRMLTPRTTMTYAAWLDHLAQEKEAKLAATLNPNLPLYASPMQFPTLRVEAPATRGQEEAPITALPTLASASGDSTTRSPEELEAIASISAEAATLDHSLNGAANGDVDDDAPLSTEDDSCEPESSRAAAKVDPTSLPTVEYFSAGTSFSIGDLDIVPFTIPHDAADPCGFVFGSRSETIRMAIATDLGYIPPNVKAALRNVDVLLLESNHDLEMLKDGPYPWSVKQRVLSRVGHLSNGAAAEFLQKDYDGGAAYIVLGHLSESNNAPELARISAEEAIGNRMTLLGNRILLARQHAPLETIIL